MNTEKIKKTIQPFVSLTDIEWRQLFDYFDFKILKKDSLFLREGQVCSSLALILRGSLIYYKLQDSGKEITTDFAFEGDWVADNRSRLSNTPSFINIKAIEESELLIISNENLKIIYTKIPKLERLGRILMEQAFVKVTQQSIDLQTLSSSQRYEKLLHEHPEIFQKIALYHIANYLGMAPKSLSRIRKK